MPEGRASESFWWHQFACPCSECDGYPEEAAALDELLATIRRMEAVQRVLGARRLVIVSGYRCPAWQQVVAEPHGEEHTRCRAVDFAAWEYSPSHVQRHLVPHIPALVRGMLSFRGLTHIDWRPGEPFKWRGTD